jgi:hypothetical protein
MMFLVPKLNCQTVREVLSYRDTDKSWRQLKDDLDLDEDLLQADYANGLVLDVGWYDDLQPNSATANPESGGAFCVQLIRNHDWESPVVSIFARDFQELSTAIEAADRIATAFPS